MRKKMKIDFVVTWVDGSDPKWLRKKINIVLVMK
ncbi:Stealth CR1 domain-containing protein [Pediococcus acidilactici]